MYLNHGSMELAYKDYSVRIVHNPSDIIVRFTDAKTMRLWQVVYTERDFVEYQVLGGLEFVASLLKDALKSEVYEISDFKVTSKQLSFTIQYAPDEHCKQINIEFLLPAIKKETANVDMESVSNRIALLEKALAELVPLQKEVAQQKDKITSLTQDLEIQKEKSAGYIVLPGCFLPIREDIVMLHLGLINTTNPLTGLNFGCGQFGNSIGQKLYICETFNNLNNLKYLKKCEILSIANPTIKDFSPIGEMSSLTTLHISFSNPSTDLVDISWIKKLTKLEMVLLFNCKGLTDISPLLGLKKLKSIDIRGSGVQNTSLFGMHITINR
jgi:hypothetical protein